MHRVARHRTENGEGRERVVEEEKEKEEKKGRCNENGEKRRRTLTRYTRAYDLDRNKSRLRPDFKAQDYKN